MPAVHHPLADLDTILADLARILKTTAQRYVLGIAGPPGAGKSTLAQRIVTQVDPSISSCVAPLDGFHRSNEDLAAAGLLALKGVPASFDAAGFVALLAQLNRTPAESVRWPTYDRSIESVIPAEMTISPQHRLIVVEGNYLLLDDPPWDRVQPLLDAVWYLDVPHAVLLPRLLARHARNRSPTAAAEKVATTDLPNAALVAATRDRADLILHAP